LGQTESGPLLIAAIFLLACAVVGVLWPQVIAWPLAALAIWIGLALIWRYIAKHAA
jgi:cardiolipin synthase